MDDGWLGATGFGRAVVAMAVVIGLAWAWPAFASTGLAWAPPGASHALDGILVFLPLLWAPLPAVVVWMAVEAEPSPSSAGAGDR